MQDADDKDVSYERLLLPFGSGNAVEKIVGSYKSISIEGGFKINNLMGLRPKADAASSWSEPSSIAISCQASEAGSSSDEVIELDQALRPRGFDATSFA